jgi:hypothetical protein
VDEATDVPVSGGSPHLRRRAARVRRRRDSVVPHVRLLSPTDKATGIALASRRVPNLMRVNLAGTEWQNEVHF